jgi:transposase
MRPGVLMAAVALAHGLNANMLRKWVIDAQHAEPRVTKAPVPEEERPPPSPTFIPPASAAPAADGEIRIELLSSRSDRGQRGARTGCSLAR